MAIERPLSLLELTVLGVVMKRGRCVANALISEFAGSRTFAYRSGAGSIYPLFKRLAAAGYLRSVGRAYEITEAGLDAIRAWMRPPFDEDAFATNLDGIRSRAYFLKLLSPEERLAFADSMTAGLEALLGDCRRNLVAQQKSGDRFGELAMLGAVRETEARIAWLREIRDRLV